MRTRYRGLVLWGEQGGCDDEFARRILLSKMKLSELERDLTQVARGREMDAMTAYRAFALHPPVRLPPDESRARPAAPGEPKKYACFSERCCGVLKDSDAFSSNQCRRGAPYCRESAADS